MVNLLILLLGLTFNVESAFTQTLSDFYCDLNSNCASGMACEDPGFNVKVKNSRVTGVEGFGYFDYFSDEKFYVKNGVLNISGLFEDEPFKANVQLSKVSSNVSPGKIHFHNQKPVNLRCNFRKY